jgi:hypothetical protein
MEPASAERSHVSLISWTGSESIRVFQMFEAGKTRHREPGTGSASALTGATTAVTANAASIVRAATVQRRARIVIPLPLYEASEFLRAVLSTWSKSARSSGSTVIASIFPAGS